MRIEHAKYLITRYQNAIEAGALVLDHFGAAVSQIESELILKPSCTDFRYQSVDHDAQAAAKQLQNFCIVERRSENMTGTAPDTPMFSAVQLETIANILSGYDIEDMEDVMQDFADTIN